jgi:hypothetical protein
LFLARLPGAHFSASLESRLNSIWRCLYRSGETPAFLAYTCAPDGITFGG